MVLALEEMVIVLEIGGTRGATMVVAKTPGVKKRTNGELFPAEFMEKSASSWVLGVNGGVGVPVDGVEDVVSPVEVVTIEIP